MGAFILWYLVVVLLGWLSFPVAFRLFHKLKDRGFGLSKVLGLLLWSYVFWLFNILQLGQNTIPGLLLALAVVLLGSWLCLRKGQYRVLLTWVKAHFQTILFIEIVFLGLFGFWALIRAANPDIIGTEKPMELAFINAILNSTQFPPRDPWLSGYAISYYYYGYVMIAMLIKITGVASWVGFNLASALWFGLTGTAAFSVIYSLISKESLPENAEAGAETAARPKANFSRLVWSLLGPIYLLIISNVEGFLEMLHTRGLFWQQGEDGMLQSRFWRWLDIQEISQPPYPPFSWVPERPAGIWWWRASRVVQDYTAARQSREVIDEFPFFSYLLSDLHPHVLAMPFALLAIAFAFNFYRSYHVPTIPGISWFGWLRSWIEGQAKPFKETQVYSLLKSLDFWFLVFLSGSLAFLNTWDFPIYVGLFAAVYTYCRFRKFGWGWHRVLEFITFGFLTGVLGVLLFLPFYVGFSSQAGGFLPSLFFFTRGVHFWVMFLPLLFPIFIWLLSILARNKQGVSIKSGVMFSILVLAGLWLLSYLVGALAVYFPAIASSLEQSGGSFSSEMAASLQHWGRLFYSTQGIAQPSDLWGSLLLRLKQPGTWVTLTLLIAVVWAVLAGRKPRWESTSQSSEQPGHMDTVEPVENGSTHPDRKNMRTDLIGGKAAPFVLLLVLLGAGLVMFPEFFYLRDQFGYRINTIFKFYFQAWMLWSIAAAAASVWLWDRLKASLKVIFGITWGAVLLMGLAYPFWGIQMKLDNLDVDRLSLNGARHIEQYSADEMQAIEWLLDAPDGVVLEAVGGSYSGYARISTYTGLPTVLGWPGHESQWRGGAEEMGSREEDIRQIYQSSNWRETISLLQMYDIRYIYIGGYEHNTYRVNTNKFDQNLNRVFESDSVSIYELPPWSADEFEGES